MTIVDIVVPCYNYARFLRRCVDSVLSQGVECRVLIIDDCSTDDTETVGRDLARDPRVEYRRHAVNQKHIKTYNEGLIGWASSRYSLLLSADDWLAPAALRRAIDFLDANPECGMVFGFALIVADEHEIKHPPMDGKRCVMSGTEYAWHVMRHANPVPTPTAVVRTALQQQIGGYSEHLPHSGDMEMWLQFAGRGSIGIIREVQAYYRWHGGNMGREFYSAAMGDLREQESACIWPLQRWPALMDPMQQTLRNRLGHRAFWLASHALDIGDRSNTDECLRFALEYDSSLPFSWQLGKFKLKRAAGKLWSIIRPLLRRSQRSEHFHVGSLTGWGPADEAAWR